MATWIAAEYAATLVHHVYGAVAYRTPERAAMAAFFTLALAVTWLLWKAHAGSGRKALSVLSGLWVGLIWVALLGVFEGGYNHAYKDVLFLLGVPRLIVLKLHPAFIPGDFVYPPDDIVLELSGVLQFFFCMPVGHFLYRLIRSKTARTASASNAKDAL